MYFFYLHGFLSDINPQSKKVKALQTIGSVIPLSYNSLASRDCILSELDAQIKEQLETLPKDSNNDSNFALIGTSLGAYYSQALARLHEKPSILINPAIDPFNSLAYAVKAPLKNHKTGVTSIMLPEALHSYEHHVMENKADAFKFPPLVLLDQEDEVFDTSSTAQYFSEFSVHTFPRGNHRFSHMSDALNIIQSYCDL